MATEDSRPKDRRAADLILAYLEEQGMSPQAFSRAAFNSGHGYVSSKTLYRIIETAGIPELRVRGVIARQMERSPKAIWLNASVVGTRKVPKRIAA